VIKDTHRASDHTQAGEFLIADRSLLGLILYTSGPSSRRTRQNVYARTYSENEREATQNLREVILWVIRRQIVPNFDMEERASAWQVSNSGASLIRLLVVQVTEAALFANRN
jgi:hypothetical protein